MLNCFTQAFSQTGSRHILKTRFPPYLIHQQQTHATPIHAECPEKQTSMEINLPGMEFPVISRLGVIGDAGKGGNYKVGECSKPEMKTGICIKIRVHLNMLVNGFYFLLFKFWCNFHKKYIYIYIYILKKNYDRQFFFPTKGF